MEKAEATYFLPVPKPGLNNNMISVRYVTGEAIKQGLDYAAFELNEKVSGRDYVRPARDIAPGPLEMVALVVNKAGYGKDMYLLDSVECSNIADGMSNMTVLDNPKRFYLHECIVLGGNSGGSVFRKGNLTDVYGLVSTGTDDPQLSNERENRRALFGEINWTGVTNARCVQLPGWPVVEPNCRDGLWN